MIQDFPVKTDIFSVFILLGVFQGLFLSYFFIFGSVKDQLQNRLLGILLLSMSIIISDIWLGYTNYMFRCIWLVDFSEPLNLLLAPAVFLYIKTSITRRYSPRDNWHFAPFIFYLANMAVIFYPQSLELKYNAYISAFHPSMPHVAYTSYGNEWLFWLKYHVNELTFVSLLCYTVMDFVFIYQKLKAENLSFFSGKNKNLAWLRNLLLKLLSVMVVFAVTRLSFKNDAGDHIVAVHIAFVIYATGFSVIRKSFFFNDHKSDAAKYENSTLTEAQINIIVEKLEALMVSEKPFLSSGFSLPSLAKKLSVSPHTLSQVLNENVGQNFFEYAAGLRVKEAIQLLRSKEGQYLKIEEIAEMVGYNSKSAFNNAFKKVTGKTPSEFKQN